MFKFALKLPDSKIGRKKKYRRNLIYKIRIFRLNNILIVGS
jgi:hypothetical protein